MKEVIDGVKRYIKFWWYDNRRTINRYLERIWDFLILWLKTAAYVLLILGIWYYVNKSTSAEWTNYDAVGLVICIVTIITLCISHIWWMDDDW